MKTTEALMVLVLLVNAAKGGTVQCFSTLTCDGPPVSTPGNTIEDCCVGTSDGLTYLVRQGREGCRACIVYGWINGSNFIGNETIEPYHLEMGFVKGIEIVSSSLVLPFRVDVTPGNAEVGANADFTVTNLYPIHRLASGINPAVSTTLRVDDLAQEVDETFQLTLVPSPLNPSLDFRETNQFLLDTLTVTIVDQDCVTFSFPESTYGGLEEDEVIAVRVRRNGAIASPVTLRIVPLNYTEYIDSGLDQSIDFPDVEPENLFTPNRAKSLPLDRRDFKATPIEVTFDPNENNRRVLDVFVPIPVFDDEINEVEEEIFVAILELVDAVNPSQVDFFDATLCKITDDDDIVVGFERPEYRFNEADFYFTVKDSPILIIKENGVVSEQIFRVAITAGVADLPGNGNAKFQPIQDDNGDYSLGHCCKTHVEFFIPEDPSFGFPFVVLDDNLPEGTEAFRLTISTTSGEGGQFSVGTIGSTVVIIEDNDDVIVGFEDTIVTVTESDLRAELCVSVFVPEETDPLLFNFFLEPTTVPGTADETDYVAFTLFNNPLIVAQFGQDLRRLCFDVTINDDIFLELPETFSVIIRLTHDSPQSGIIVDPADATIVILDDDLIDSDSVTLVALTDTGVEDEGILFVHVLKLGSNSNSITLVFNTRNNNAKAGKDYEAVSEWLIFGPEDTERVVNITIVDDNILEGPESFFGIFELVGDSPNVELQESVIEINIIDNDGTYNSYIPDLFRMAGSALAITIGFAPDEYTVLESAGFATLNIAVLNGFVGTDISLDLSTIDGSALDTEDYRAITAQTVTFTPTSPPLVQVKVTITDDDRLDKLQENFKASLTLVSPILLDAITIYPDLSNVVIQDDDAIAIGFDSPEYTVLEDDGVVNITVRLVSGSLVGSDIAVYIFLTDDSGKLDFDVMFSTRTLIFNQFNTELTVQVAILDDDLTEETEIFSLNARLVDSALNNQVVLIPNEARVLIVDNDVQLPFQLRLPMDYCTAWSLEKVQAVLEAIRNETANAVRRSCNCSFPADSLANGKLSCQNSSSYVTYRSTISYGHSTEEVLSYIETWVSTSPTIVAGPYIVSIDPSCTTRISSLTDPECPPPEIRELEDEVLITKNPTAISCINKCGGREGLASLTCQDGPI